MLLFLNPDVSIPSKEPEQNPETSTEKLQNPNVENTVHVPPLEEEESIFMEIPKPKAKKTVNVEIQDLKFSLHRSITHPIGIAEDGIVRVDGFTFLVDFVVVNFEPDPRVPIILGRHFLRTAKALIDLYEEIVLRVGEEELSDPLHLKFAGELLTLPSGNDREFEEYLSLMTVLCEISTPDHRNYDLIPPGVENDYSEDEVNESPNLDHQDDPSIPHPPPEPPDIEKCFKPEAGYIKLLSAYMQDLYDRMGRMEIRQEAIERMEYRQLYHWDRYQGVFEHMAGVYSIPLQGAYKPDGYAQPQYDQYYQQYPPPPSQYQQQQQDDDEYFLELRSEQLQISHPSLRLFSTASTSLVLVVELVLLVTIVIQKGNGPVQVSTDTNRQIRVLPPKTAKEILARRPVKQEEPKALVTLDGDGVDWTGHAEDEEQLGDASIEIQAYTQALKKVEAQLVCHQKNQLVYEEKIRFMKIDLDDQNQMSAKDKSGLGYGDQIHEGVLSYENEVLESVFDNRSSDVEDSPVYDRFAKVEGMHAVPPPMTGIYMPHKSNFGIDELKFTYGPKQSKTSKSDAKTSDFASYESNSSVETLESVPKPAVMNRKLFGHLIRDCDFHEKRMAKLVELNKQKGKGTGQRENRIVWNNVQRLNHQNKFVPKAVLTKTGRFLVNAARQNLSSPMQQQLVLLGGNRETDVKASTGCNWRSKRHYWNKVSKYNSGSSSSKNVNFKDPLCRPKSTMAWVPKSPQKALKNKGIVDSGCQITGKCKIITGKLNFEDVYFVKELKQFNLFSVSQMCDKKNKLLFTDSECLVMSLDFKFPDENKVLLRVPRQNNMYSFNL
ncbi:ribonuclease H-like domain-containing protein [Tanacetum coccineum]